MNYAVYFLAIGDKAIDCLNFSYNSLRLSGFNGDVYILSDKESVPFSVSKNTKVIKVKENHFNLDKKSNRSFSFFDIRRLDKNNPRNVRVPEFVVICHLKSLIDKYIDIKKYDYIVYLDVDVLTAGSITDLEKYIIDNNGSIITAQNKELLKLGGRGNFSFKKLKRVKTVHTTNLSNWELLKFWFYKAICADIVCFPGNDLGLLLLDMWRKECQKGLGDDQTALQAILLRNFKDIHILAPLSLFGHNFTLGHSGNLEKKDSTFIHFSGSISKPDTIIDYYKSYIKKYDKS